MTIPARHSLSIRLANLLRLASQLPQGLLLAALLLVWSCASPGDDPNQPNFPQDPPCSCKTGERRCLGAAAQVCEQESATCSSWGEPVFCPSAACMEGVCQGDCT